MLPQQPTGRATIRAVSTHGAGIHPGTTPLPSIPGTTTDGMIPGTTALGALAGTIPGIMTTHGAGAGIVLTITAAIMAGAVAIITEA